MEFKSANHTIQSYGLISLTVSRKPDPACVMLLQRAEYGTNGIRYQQTGQEVKLYQLTRPHFFHLYDRDELIGMYCLDERVVTLPAGEISAFYGRYLVVDQRHAGKGYGHLLKHQATRYISEHTAVPHLFYSYVEAQNLRSLRISEREGFGSVGTLATYIFRRYAPKVAPGFSKLEQAERQGMMAQLSAYYKQHTFKTFDGIGYEGNYFVLREREEIVAGIQANPVCWQFLQMPGISGWLTMHLLPLLPVTKRFFNPDRYTFAALEGVYLKEPNPIWLYTLLESVLAHFGFNSALWLLDDTDPINSLLNQSGAGLLSGYQKHVTTHVLTKEVGGPDQDVKVTRPLYVSSFDYA